MNLVIPGNYYVEIPRVIDLKEVKIDVDGFKKKNGVLEINISINTFFYRSSYDEVLCDNQKKTLSMLIDDELDIKDIKFIDIKGEVVVNQGIELIYDMSIVYQEVIPASEIIDIIDKEKDLLLTKELLTRSNEAVDEEVLEESILEIGEYNDESSEDSLIELEDGFTTIKFISVKNEQELEGLSLKYNIPLQEIYRQNNFNITSRVVVEINEWSKVLFQKKSSFAS